MSRRASPLRVRSGEVRSGAIPVLTDHERIVLTFVVENDHSDRSKATGARVPGERQMMRSQWTAAIRSLTRKQLLVAGGTVLTPEGHAALARQKGQRT